MSNTETGVKYPNVRVKLVGESGNAFGLIGRTTAALRGAYVPEPEVSAFVAEATCGDYDHVLQTIMRWVKTS